MNKALFLTILLFFTLRLHAQNIIASSRLQVTTNQTTNLVFPSAIVSIDRGSEHIIVQKSLNNILRVKADGVFSDTTNLTVVTTDGKLYSFLVSYTKYPDQLTLNLGQTFSVDKDTAVAGVSRKVLQMRNNLYGIKCSESKVQFSLLGVYATGELIVCKVKIENNSSLSYRIGELHVLSRDVSAGKRRSTQEREVQPIQSISPEALVKERGVYVFTVVLPKPSLSHSRNIRIELSEKDGERNLSLEIRNRYLVSAVSVE